MHHFVYMPMYKFACPLLKHSLWSKCFIKDNVENKEADGKAQFPYKQVNVLFQCESAHIPTSYFCPSLSDHHI